MITDDTRFHPNLTEEDRAEHFQKQDEKRQARRNFPVEIWEHKYGWSTKLYG